MTPPWSAYAPDECPLLRWPFCCECRASARTSVPKLDSRQRTPMGKPARPEEGGKIMPGRRSSFPFPGRARLTIGFWAALAPSRGNVERKGWARKSAMLRRHSLAPRSCSEYQAGRATGLVVLPASLTLVRGVPNLSLGGNNERKKVAHSGIAFDSGSYRVPRGKFRIGTG